LKSAKKRKWPRYSDDTRPTITTLSRIPGNITANHSTWNRHSVRPKVSIELKVNGILEGNGINDEDLELEELGMDPESWTPAIHLYYNDDLTAA